MRENSFIRQVSRGDLDMGLAQAAYLYRRYKLVDYLNPIANYDFILGSLC